MRENNPVLFDQIKQAIMATGALDLGDMTAPVGQAADGTILTSVTRKLMKVDIKPESFKQYKRFALYQVMDMEYPSAPTSTVDATTFEQVPMTPEAGQLALENSKYVLIRGHFETEPVDDTDKGLYTKYRVERTDGSEKHHECDYFVLDMNHDKYAKVAIEAYVKACEAEYPQLAADLRARYL